MSKKLADDGWPVDLATSAALEAYRQNLRLFDSTMAMIRAHAEFDGGIVVVAAAVNESKRSIDPDYEVGVSIPAVAEGIISVGAFGQGASGLIIAPFSNTFPLVGAPGVGIRSAKTGGGLRALNGTSMACPHVAGTAALWWQAVRERGIPATAGAVSARIQATARSDVFAPGTDVKDRGAGIITAPQ